ncbi:MAG: ABC-type transporter, integral rane subunit [Gemmatimonadetes bacterium]|jgi:peptide/nickel transport system permease protein|nr:ABC-type transporter, integral rane subunit [Gemmatimonadota bacterium]
MRYHRVRSPALLRALVRAVLLFWCVLSLTFALLRLAPGDPATFLLPPGASADDAARMRSELGLNQSMAVQYARWLRESLAGQLGDSFVDRRPVRAVIADALPISIGLGGASLLLSFAIGTVLGLIQAARRGTRLDLALTTASVLLVASPAYWLGLGAIACFTYLASSWSLPLFMRLPAIGMATPGAELSGLAHIADLLRHSILPVTLLAAIGAGGVARYVRTGALDAMGSDWMRTARAKGANERQVYGHHLLANLRAPLLTLFALALPGTVAGSVFVETIFAWPGMGRLMVTSIVARDYPVVMGCAATFAAMVIVANLLAEALLPWADPRVRE